MVGHRNKMWLFHTRNTIFNRKKIFEAHGDERHSSNTLTLYSHTVILPYTHSSFLVIVVLYTIRF